MTHDDAGHLHATWLGAWLRARLQSPADPSPDPDTEFGRLGVDSVGLVELARALAEHLGRPVPATIAWEHPTVARLARWAASPDGRAPAADPRAEPARRRRGPDAPIAVVGIGCRLPGAGDRAAFWDLLREGRCAVRPIDPARAALFRDVDPDADPLTAGLRAGFLDGIDRFDPRFFGISPREAERMDPQQRLLLEVAWEALDDAALAPSRLRGTDAGVWIGACWSDWLATAGRAGLAEITAHTATGSHFSILANRVSYLLGLTGPSMAVDSACSSSLTAVDLACRALRDGECGVALAGGVNVMSGPDSSVAMRRLGALSPDGRCKAFDAAADGYGRGEGAVVLVLKPLARAEVDGDRVYAVILGSAVGNDGATNGLTAPSQGAQEQVVARACASAGVAPGDLAYVEAHGTGTPLGDPIEARALGAVAGGGRSAGRRLRLGSVKTNLGHVESASGAAGLAKVALALHHDLLPASLHFERPSPHVDFEGLGLEVQARSGPWPDGPRLAGVSSFGFGGTNVHAVLAAAPRATTIAAPTPAAAGERVAFVYSGHGGHHAGMGRALLAAEPAFAAAVRRVDAALRDHGGESVLELLAAPEPDRRVDRLQPTVFALQVGLTEWLASRGIVPDAVVGHSFGEVAAALAAGILDLDGAARVIRHYTRLQAATAGDRGMAVVELDLDELAVLGVPDLELAAVNAPRQLVVGGPGAAVDAAVARVAAAGRFARRLDIDVAAHGSAIDPVRAALDDALAAVVHLAPEVPFFSTSRGGWLTEAPTPACWSHNLRHPVRFSAAAEALGDAIVVELGPHPVLLPVLPPGRRGFACLRRDREPHETLGAVVAAVGRPESADPAPRHLVALSGHDPAALADRARALRVDGDLADLSHTSLARAEHRAHRVVFAARDAVELAAARDAFLAGSGELAGTDERGPAPVFVFAGQGGQWPGMARRLLATEPGFRHAFRRCAAAIAADGGPDLSGSWRLDDIDFVQPLLFAYQVAAATLLRSFGVAPAAVVGHSMGEVAAAVVAGALGPEDGARVVTRRSRLLLRVSGRGGMALVEAGADDARALLAAWPGLSVAAWNGPRSTLVAGESAALARFVEAAAAAGRFARVVRAPVASHSAQMDPLLDELRAALADLAPREPELPFRSTVTEGPPPALDADYWVANLRRPVRFAPVIDEAVAAGHRRFVEVGPHPVLTGAVAEALAARGVRGVARAVGRRDHDERDLMRETLAALHVDGVAIAWDTVLREGGRVADLPPTAWQRIRCWPAPPARRSASWRGPWRESSAEPDRAWREASVSATSPPWVADHRVGGEVVFPATGWLSLLEPPGDSALADVLFEQPLVLGPEARELQVARVGDRVTASSRTGATWVRHASARLVPAARLDPVDPSALRARLPEVPVEAHVAGMSRLGLDYGPAFRGLRALWATDDEAFAELAHPASVPATDADGRLHPCLLDACLQLFVRVCGSTGQGAFVAASVGRAHLSASAAPALWCHARRTGAGRARVVVGDGPRVVAVLDDVVGSALRADAALHVVERVPQPLGSASRAPAAPPVVVTVPDLPPDEIPAFCAGVAARAVALAEAPTPPRLWLVTRAADTSLAGAAAHGLAGAVRAELPGLSCSVVDLPRSGADEALAAELAADSPEPRVWLGADGVRRVSRLRRLATPTGPLPLRRDRSVVVTGGAGGLGAAVVRRLAAAGAGPIVTVGRGAGLDGVEHVRGDLADPGTAARAVAAAEARAPLQGVIHAAGVLDDALLGDQDTDRFARTWAPKVAGALALEAAVGDRALDFFVLYGSVAAVLGLPGQANYCAANAALDAIVARRRADGRPALAIAWGLFLGAGLADRAGRGDRLAADGLGPMTPEEGADRLLALLGGSAPPSVAVLRLDAARWRLRVGASADPLLADLVNAPAAPARPSLRRELAGATDPGEAVTRWLRGHVAEVLRLPADRLAGDEALTAAGLDSMMALELRERVRVGAEVHLPLLAFFDGATLATLAGRLRAELALPAALHEPDDTVEELVL